MRGSHQAAIIFGIASVCLSLLAVPYLASPNRPHQSSGPVNYVASVNSEVYHLPSCRYVKRIHDENLETFTTAEEAERCGHRACKVCRP